MKTGLIGVVALAFAASTLTSTLAQRPRLAGKDRRQATDQRWLASLDEGFAQSRESGKPLMVVIRCQP